METKTHRPLLSTSPNGYQMTLDYGSNWVYLVYLSLSESISIAISEPMSVGRSEEVVPNIKPLFPSWGFSEG